MLEKIRDNYFSLPKTGLSLGKLKVVEIFGDYWFKEVKVNLGADILCKECIYSKWKHSPGRRAGDFVSEDTHEGGEIKSNKKYPVLGIFWGKRAELLGKMRYNYFSFPKTGLSLGIFKRLSSQMEDSCLSQINLVWWGKKNFSLWFGPSETK